MTHPALFWMGFHLLIALLLAIDLRFLSRKAQAITLKRALILSGFWISVALLFNLFIYFSLGAQSALQFFTGYLIEKSLSVDNLFLFLMIFLHFQIPAAYQRKILFWGILGALVFRIAFILAGSALIHQFHWMFYVFGAFLLFSGVKFLQQKPSRDDPTQGFLFRTLSRLFPVAIGDSQGRFFVRSDGKWKITSLFLALLMVECTDIILALDSIPAIFAITTDPFIVYTSNIFALLGLRALYFALSSSLNKLKYLKVGLATVLIFIGAKMLLADWAPIPLPVALAIILLILSITTVASLCKNRD
jgi:tellurite resistance protein TerC